MPRLNVTRVLSSREFVDRTLVCRRSTQVVGDNGRPTNTTMDTPFSGVVTNDTGDLLVRLAAGSYVKGSILVHSKFPLIDGRPGNDADIVIWQGRSYTVASVNDYSTYGAGFTCASCEPLNLAGG